MRHKILLAGVLSTLLAGNAIAAGESIRGYGPRLGFSLSPDQLVFGGQLVTGEIAQNTTFDPSLELGFGDNVTVVAFNLDLHYHFTLQGSDWMPYAGAGIGINFLSFDAPPPFRDESNTEIGGNLILGAGVPTRDGSRFFTEARFGLGDIPEVKLIAGWNFKM